MKKIILLMILFIMGCNTAANQVTTKATNDEFIKIPISDVTNTMQKYTYDANGVNVVYFTVLGSDGAVRTAFDACDVCGGYKGYRQEGNDVVCNNCGRYFSIDDIGELNSPGGCWPSFLNHKIEENTILISTKELEAGAFRFA